MYLIVGMIIFMKWFVVKEKITLFQYINNSSFPFVLQMEALRQAAASNPNGRWWIKADACDVRKGLRESVRGAWAGDQDLGDDYVQQLYQQYKTDCSFIKELTAPTKLNFSLTEFQKLQSLLESNVEFLSSGVAQAKISYEKVLQTSHPSEKSMMELSWDYIGFEELQKQNKELSQEVACIVNNFMCGQHNVLKTSVLKVRDKLLSYLKELYSKKRVAASHLMIFMISDELRNTKPYAVPVRFIPYASITDSKLRELELQIEDAMVSVNMVTVGKYYVNGIQFK